MDRCDFEAETKEFLEWFEMRAKIEKKREKYQLEIISCTQQIEQIRSVIRYRNSKIELLRKSFGETKGIIQESNESQIEIWRQQKYLAEKKITELIFLKNRYRQKLDNLNS